jgi:predicted RNA binding protein YcfA (HicA-like mRNA interferase family)
MLKTLNVPSPESAPWLISRRYPWGRSDPIGSCLPQLRRHGVECDESRGKGSHILFRKKFPEGVFTFPVPTRNLGVCTVADRSLTLKDLKHILAQYGVECDKSRGKGSHILFRKKFPEGIFTFPVPRNKDVLICYVQGCRKKFRLRSADGVLDSDFYGKM